MAVNDEGGVMAELDAILARLDRLEAENTALREELGALRGSAARPTPQPPTAQASPSVSRRAVIARGATVAAAGVAAAVGASAMGSRVANAGTQYLKVDEENLSYTTTSLYGQSSGSPTLLIKNENAYIAVAADSFNGPTAIRARAFDSGNSINATKPSDSPTGHAVLAEQLAANSTYAAAAGVTKGSGPGLYGRADSTGDGVWGNAAGASAAGIKGTNPNGRGGVFSGQKAQVRLLPSADTTRPASGARGDLFVDKSGRLWFCKGGTNWKQLA
jgi:hypothetical protein